MDGTGRALVMIAATEEAGVVSLMDVDGQLVARIGAAEDGTGIVIVMDPSGRDRRGVFTTRP